MAPRRSRDRSLTARLFAIVFASVFLSFVAATAIAAYASWTVYEGDAEQRLKKQAEIVEGRLAGLLPKDMTALLASLGLADTRITLIAPDGTVLYDNVARASEMENHADREEVIFARERGESVVMRRSETTRTDLLYAATLVDDDGMVLRMAESRASFAVYIGNLLAPLSMAVLVAALLSALLARNITRRIVAPLLEVDLDAPLANVAYREVKPLLNRIDIQRTELLAQNAQLENAVEMRREFTGNVSHEMKSPLQVIGGYAELIESGIANPEDAKRFAGLIRAESQSMRTLIDDVLTLSRLDEGADGDIRAVDVTAVVLRVVERLSSAARAKNIRVSTSLEEAAFAMGREPLVEQAVYNLVDNAIRHGDGHVEIATALNGAMVRIAVLDDGPGIPDVQRERVFERFYRLEPSRSRDTGGTGLGLAIVKHAAESMGGSVIATESEMGGAAFILELPAR